MNPISVIIVSWNARGFLRDCLLSIAKDRQSLLHEIIVVDNASSDGSPEMVEQEFPDVILLRAGDNLGFARANNLGMQRATGRFLAFINSDVVVHPGCFQTLADFLEQHEDVGLVGPKILGRDGDIQFTCGELPNLWNTTCRFLALDRVLSRWRIFGGFQLRHWNYDARKQVEVLSGCFWLTRRSAVDQVGGLDERFFFYAEDVDWCRRFRDAGWKIMFVPEATATHFGEGSSSNAPLRYSVEMLRASSIYWQKYYGKLGRSGFYLLAMMQHTLRLIGRTILKIARVGNSANTNEKLKEHIVCLRWLLTGKNV